MLGTKESAESIVIIGKELLEDKNGKPLDETVEAEINEFMAAAYEELGETESALALYKQQLETEQGHNKREALYKKITLLHDTLGQPDMAGEVCRKGIEELKDSMELRILYISLLCKNKGVERAVCAQTIQQYLQEMPQIAEQEEFGKLKREYDIQLEGEQICVGK